MTGRGNAINTHTLILFNVVRAFLLQESETNFAADFQDLENRPARKKFLCERKRSRWKFNVYVYTLLVYVINFKHTASLQLVNYGQNLTDTKSYYIGRAMGIYTPFIDKGVAGLA
jgi:hypothetical protein